MVQGAGFRVEVKMVSSSRQEAECFFFFFTLVTSPRRSLSLKLSDTRVYEPQIRGGMLPSWFTRGPPAPVLNAAYGGCFL